MATDVENIQNSEREPKSKEPVNKALESEPKETDPVTKETERVLKKIEPVPMEYVSARIESEPVPKETESVPKETESVPKENESVPKETESVLKETEPVPKETERVLKEIELVPMEYESAAIESEPVPKETESVPKETESVPKETEPVPKETERVLKEIELVPMEYESAAIESEPVPKETESVPKETESVPKETESVPKETESVPKETEPVPKETERVLKEIELVPMEYESARIESEAMAKNENVIEPDSVDKEKTHNEPAFSLKDAAPAPKEPTLIAPESTFKVPAPRHKEPEAAPNKSKSAREEAGPARQLTTAEKSNNSDPEFKSRLNSIVKELCVEMAEVKKCFYNIPPDEKFASKEFKPTACLLEHATCVMTDCPPLPRDADEREDEIMQFIKGYVALGEQEFSKIVEHCSLTSLKRPEINLVATNKHSSNLHNENTDNSESEVENDDDGDHENTEMNGQRSIEKIVGMRRTDIQKLKTISGLLKSELMDSERTGSSSLSCSGGNTSHHKLAKHQKGDVPFSTPEFYTSSKQENDNSEQQNRRRSKRINKNNTKQQSIEINENSNHENNQQKPSTSETKPKPSLHSACVAGALRRNEEKKYKRLPQDFVNSGPDDLKPWKVLVYCVSLYRPFITVGPMKGVVYKHRTTRGPRLQQNYYFLGSHTLADLRDVFKCPNDFGPRTDCSKNPDEDYIENLKDLFPSACMFINNIFYSDMRHPKAIDYSLPIRKWACKRGYDFVKSENMDDVTFDSLKIRLGHPELYIHQGNCEHVFTFSSVELLQPSDICVSSTYPYSSYVRRRYAINCNICARFIAKWVILGCERIPNDPAYLCSECFSKYNYVDGKKLGEFSAYRLLDRNIQVYNNASQE